MSSVLSSISSENELKFYIYLYERVKIQWPAGPYIIYSIVHLKLESYLGNAPENIL